MVAMSDLANSVRDIELSGAADAAKVTDIGTMMERISANINEVKAQGK